METGDKDIIHDLCLNFGFGNVIGEPIAINGGLLHTIFKVTTDVGDYAIKCLNPVIMSRKGALTNMINSEKISEVIGRSIPVISAVKLDSNHVHRYKNQYYMFFHWFEGKSIFPPEIKEDHCSVIGDLVGKIHSLDITIEGIVDETEASESYRWNEYLEMATKYKDTWASVYEKAYEDIMVWEQKVLIAKAILSKEKVISHRDLDPKNVMWRGNSPFIIDWEAAGYVNPYQELIEVLNYWANDGNGGLHRELFIAILKGYKAHKAIDNVNWDVVLDSGYEGMLGWLEYNIKRALGIEIATEDEIRLGEQQVINTISELREYQEKTSLLKKWLNSECLPSIDDLKMQKISNHGLGEKYYYVRKR